MVTSLQGCDPPGMGVSFVFNNVAETTSQPSGLGQQMLRIGAFDYQVQTGNFGTPSLAYPILGAMDAHTLVIATNVNQGQQGIAAFNEITPISSNVTLTRDSTGLVTIQNWGSVDLSRNPQTFSITCSSDSSFNVTNATPSYTEGGGFTYQTSDTTPVTSAVNAVWTSGTGRNICKTYFGVEQIRTGDATQAQDNPGANIGLEYNTIKWVANATVESPSHFGIGMLREDLAMQSSLPTLGSGNRFFNINGPIANQNFVFANIVNNQPDNYYAGQGGYATPPWMFKAWGNWQSIIDCGNYRTKSGSVISLPSWDQGKTVAQVPRHTTVVFGNGTTRAGYAPSLQIDWRNNQMTYGMGGAGLNLIGQDNQSVPEVLLYGSSINLNNTPLQNLPAGVYGNDAVIMSQVEGVVVGGNVSLAGSTLTAGSADTQTLSIDGATVGQVCSAVYADGTDHTEGGRCQLTARVTAASTVTITRRLSAYATASYTTPTKTINVVVFSPLT